MAMAVAGCQTPAATTGADGATTSSALVGKSLIDAAREAERQGDFANAVRYYRSVYNREPSNVAALVGLSRGLRHLNRAGEAEAMVERALSQAARDPELLSEMGKVQVALGKPLEAIESLSKAISMGASRWDVETALAVGYDRIGMYDKAERHYQNALSQNPGNAVVFNNFGLSRAQAGDLDGAVNLLEKAVALPESTPRMRQNLALLYAIRGDLSAAESLVSRDLSGDDAAANMAYYRRLRESVSHDGKPPRLPDLGTATGAGPDVGAVVGDVAPVRPARPDEPKVAAVPQQPVQAVPAETKPAETKPTEAKPAAEATDKPAASETTTAQASSDPWKQVGSGRTAEPKTEAPTAPAKAETPASDSAPHALVPGGRKAAAERSGGDGATTRPAPSSGTAAKPDAAAVVVPPAAVPDTAKKPAAKEPAAKTPMAQPVPAKRTMASTGPRSTVDGRYAVQLGSYRQRARAEQHIDQVQTDLADLLRELELSVVAAEVEGKGTYYRVVAGRIADYRVAQQLCADLKTRDAACLVIRAQ